MQYGKAILIKQARIYTETGIIIDGSLLIKNGKIAEIYSDDESGHIRDVHVIDGRKLNVIPGFIDGHIHGGYGVDVMDGTEDALRILAGNLPKEGTTSFLATTITESEEKITNALMNIANYKCKAGEAELIGIHLEGPFINRVKAGAQPFEYIIPPSIEKFKKWQALSNNKIKTVTLAPECDEDGSFIRFLVDAGVNVSAGHTNVGFSRMKRAYLHGVRQVTHLCNAMTQIHHRDIGVVGAAFLLNEIRGELIADCIHIAPEMLQLIYDNMGSERIILITDAMRAKGLEDGEYELGSQTVYVKGNRATLKDGTLAGSVLKMNDAAKQMLKATGVTLHDIIKMTSTNIAKQLGFDDKKGSIAIGKDADILLVDDRLNIKYTICSGIIAYKNDSFGKK